MEIDLIKILKLNLNINEYLTLIKIDANHQQLDFPFTSTEKTLSSLQNKGYITVDHTGNISLSNKGEEAIKPPKDEINFDELFEIYPYKTPNGRILRTKNKEIGGRLTKEYKFLKDKYLLRVHKQDLHNQVVKATESMLIDKKRTNSLDFLQQLEVYINKQGWERYMQEDGVAIEIQHNLPNIERL